MASTRRRRRLTGASLVVVTALVCTAATTASASRQPTPTLATSFGGAPPCWPALSSALLGRAGSPPGVAGSLPRPGCAAHFVVDPAACLAAGKK